VAVFHDKVLPVVFFFQKSTALRCGASSFLTNFLTTAYPGFHLSVVRLSAPPLIKASREREAVNLASTHTFELRRLVDSNRSFHFSVLPSITRLQARVCSDLFSLLSDRRPLDEEMITFLFFFPRLPDPGFSRTAHGESLLPSSCDQPAARVPPPDTQFLITPRVASRPQSPRIVFSFETTEVAPLTSFLISSAPSPFF